MISVTLHGPLRDRFGGDYRFEVRSAAEAIRALASQKQGFREEIEAGSWTIVDGDLATGCTLNEEQLRRMLRSDELHILPAIDGEKGEGKSILGAVLMVASFFVPGGPFVQSIVFNAGVASFLGGLSMMLAPSPKAEEDNRLTSYGINTPNVSAQRTTMPCVYGRVVTGSVVASSGVTTERNAYYAPPDEEKVGEGTLLYQIIMP